MEIVLGPFLSWLDGASGSRFARDRAANPFAKGRSVKVPVPDYALHPFDPFRMGRACLAPGGGIRTQQWGRSLAGGNLPQKIEGGPTRIVRNPGQQGFFFRSEDGTGLPPTGTGNVR